MADLVCLVIAGSKLVDYLLDLGHPGGGSKARFFIARGFSRDDPETLARALNDHLASDDTTRTIAAAPDGRPEKRMVAVGPLGCPDGSVAHIKAIWQFEEGSDTATFVTAYPARRSSIIEI